MDRAQEHLHYVTDIANEIIFILDSDSPTMPQTPDDDGLASPSSLLRKHTNYSSESSENLDKESREGTPSTPNRQFFNRSLSGPGSGGTSDSLSPCADCTSRKCNLNYFKIRFFCFINNYVILRFTSVSRFAKFTKQ